MKKKRIDFRGLSEILSEKEMRHVLGGSGDGSGSGTGSGTGSVTNSGTCGINITCGSTRIDSIRGMSKDFAISQQAAFYKDPDALGYYSMQCQNGSVNAYWCCDSCN